MVGEFDSKEEAVECIQDSGSWGVHYKNNMAKGTAITYKCTIPRRGQACGANMQLFVPKDSLLFIVRQSDQPHDCVPG